VPHPLSATVLDTAPPGQTPAVEAREVVTGAAVGAALGAIIGGDLRAALLGAFLGAGAGTVVSLGTGDVEPVLPEGTVLRIQTRDRVDLRP
jgi:N-acetylglucosamine kinase-like BadF-type ATPase